jgi:hypothetical protein
MNVPVTCRGGLHPPKHQLRLSVVGVASPLENRDVTGTVWKGGCNPPLRNWDVLCQK